ncbi:MAG TPA: YdcF family protein [Opitutaceae bacterium]|nr:YdcF family protein [Opitutaceae bacterium]
MTLVILILLLVGLVVAAWQRKRALPLILSLLLVVFLLMGGGPIPRALLSGLQTMFVPTAPLSFDKHIAVVVLGAGTMKLVGSTEVIPTLFGYARIAKAAAAYHTAKQQGSDCKVIVSGGDPGHRGLTEAAAYAAQLTAMGVPTADILQEDKSQNTFQNAQFVKTLLASEPFDQVLLVTSALHMKRSLIYFDHFGLHPTPLAADFMTAQLTWWPLGTNFAAADLAWHEYVGIARLHVYNYLGLNK